MNKIYIAFIHRWSNNGSHGILYLGAFTTKEKAEEYCNAWNRHHENDRQFASFICDDNINKPYKDAE